jgi:mRNA-degrading endonuclease toxin of MazEF toxin-antitoxin module
VTVRQGEIRAWLDDTGRDTGMRVLVVSGDEVNEDIHPIVVPLRRGRDDYPPYLVSLAEQDPVAGTANVAQLGFELERQLGEVIGIVTGATMERIRQAIQELIAP